MDKQFLWDLLAVDYANSYFGDISEVCYEKFLQLIVSRAVGSDEPFEVVWKPWDFTDQYGGTYTDGDQFSVSMDRYLYDDSSYFHKSLRLFESVMDGEVIFTAPVQDGELQALYESGYLLGDEPELIEKAKKYSLLSEGYFKAIPDLELMLAEAQYENLEAGDWCIFAMSSKKLGAYAKWADSFREKPGFIEVLDRLYKGVTHPLLNRFTHVGTHDGVVYSVAFCGMDGYSMTEPVTVSDLCPCWVAQLYLLNDAIDRLNSRYGFYGKEVENGADIRAA